MTLDLVGAVTFEREEKSDVVLVMLSYCSGVLFELHTGFHRYLLAAGIIYLFQCMIDPCPLIL